MTNLAFDMTDSEDVGKRPPEARAIPRITIQAFCDTPEVAGTIETAAMDRRMARAHVKVHTGVTLTSDGSFTGGTTLHTGQLFFDETVTAALAKVSPYSSNTVTRTTLSQDSIYDGQGAASGLLTLTALGGTPAAGYTGTLTLGVDRS